MITPEEVNAIYEKLDLMTEEERSRFLRFAKPWPPRKHGDQQQRTWLSSTTEYEEWGTDAELESASG